MRSDARALAISQAVGVAAAIVIAVLGNVLAARHFRRWDWTREGFYTLSHTTAETLSSLPEPVEVWVLSSDSEPITLTLRHLLTAYRAKTDRLVLHFIDPDTSPAELMAAQQRLGIVAGKSENGHVLTDATVVITRGERRHYISSGELVVVEQGEEMRVRPQVERVITAGLREVIAGEPVEVCFTTGHGEPSIDAGGEEGLMPLAQRLVKSNYKVVPLPPLAEVEAKDPIGECALVIVAGPQQRFAKRDVDRLRQYLDDGGNLLVAAGPLPDEAGKGFTSLGLDPVYAAAGLAQRQDLVFERDPKARAASGAGERFIARLEKHASTEALAVAGDALPVMIREASSLEQAKDAAVKPSPLLGTSPQAFGMTDFMTWASSGAAPEPGPADARGPLHLAFAVELAKRKAGAHGPRVVAMASGTFLAGRNWSNPEYQGTAYFVESEVSWLASKTVVLDIPDKKARPMGLNLTEDALKTIVVEVVVALPLVVLALGIVIRWQRGASEARSRRERKA